ncbi:tRNA threonylcarbamoyladenosine dehydratase [Maudiozyma exigua]|uniref:tRNA threonylcarbamoyladenosine dehydratase n=1 Tax=Maudiozyma exigua TaxID=34358 RepID=A0A9P7B5R1_MAUEX|nr:tRNA threonylcarbamoyladenosine dehydratase [Kazachstania exigua]
MTKDTSGTWKVVVNTAALAVATTKLAELGWKKYQLQSEKKANERKLSLSKPKYDDTLFREQLARNYAFLGEQGMENVKNQYVVVVGAGGVGSWVVTMLLRSGVQKIRIIDFDQVSLSSLNRHSCATLKDVGTPKVLCLKNHMLEVAPWCEIDAINELWELKDAERLLFENGKPDLVVDCIDNIDTKVDLLAFLHENKIDMISSMGASAKSDPTRINVGDISVTEEDPLARAVRRRLKQKGIVTGVPVVFSAEKPDPRKAKLLPLPDDEYEKGQVGELSALKDFRVRILPVLGTMPAIFGLTIVTYILTKVSGYPMTPIEGKNRIKVYDGILQSLAGQMSRIGQKDQRVPIALSDVGYIVVEVFRGKSPISGYSTRLALTKWDPSKPVSLQNVVLVTSEEQKEHEKRVLNGGEQLEDVYSPEVLELVSKRFGEEKYYSQFR